jgi:hypothetical protein
MSRPIALCLVLSFAACAPPASDGITEAALSSAVDLISPATCALRGTHLVSCAIPAQNLTFAAFANAVPLRTTVSSQKSGSCSTPYSLQVSLKPDQDAAVNFAFLPGGQIKVRRADHGLISLLALADGSSWTPYAAFDQSCRISLAISGNEPDVDSKSDAQAIIDQLTKDVAAKQATRDNYRALDLYHQAYVFLRNVADNFLGQLSNDDMQELRSAALDAQPSLETLITSCNDLTQDQRAALLRLDLGLAALGHPEDWVNPDGSKKTLVDFLGGSDQQVLSVIDSLGSSSDGGTPPDYDALYKQADADYQAAAQKLTLAKAQLATWLN